MTGTLERIIRGAGARRAEAAEHCDLCSAPIPAEHRHLYDTAAGELMCACRPCSLLFDREAASEGHYRQVPQRRVRLSPVPTGALGVPVGLAFFVVQADATVVARYPSPVGPTEWEADAEAWGAVVDGCPALAGLEPDVEALLVNTARGAQEHWLVPIDDCYRLVAVVRREWRGMSGGGTVWPEIERFFAELTERR